MTDDPAGEVRLDRPGGGVGRIVLARAGKRNALSTRMLTQLGARLDEVAADPQIRVVTICGDGPVFCAGADTVEFAGTSAEDIRGSWTRLGQRVFAALAELPQTTVAVLSGSSYGGGVELAMHCDFRVAANTIELGMPEVTLGTTPGWSGLSRITQVAGITVARRLALTGRPVGAVEALRLGLVDFVGDDAHAAATELVESLLATAPIAQSIIKRALAHDTPRGASTLIDSLAGAYLCAHGETSATRRTS
ncbi:enoyl-CoA hydratase/isomerase family protein [Mycolicibacterium sp.]|uniref:enoyl-CoA hydratase/isomerase family protein n=1 Tax=Mycolicibacterium sp. TaxID=2320850 RepID=UPI003D0C2F07